MNARANWLRRIGLLLIAGVALGGSGCLAVAAGAVAAGAVGAGAVYMTAPVASEFKTDLPNAQAAAQVALQDLGLPVLGTKQDAGEIVIASRTGDGSNIDITLDTVPTRIPADGPKTRAQIRVGFSGDKELSERIIGQMAKRLQGGVPLTPAPVVVTGQTSPPPLANAPQVQTPPPVAQTVAAVQTAAPPLAQSSSPSQTAAPPLASATQTGPPPLAAPASTWQPRGN